FACPGTLASRSRPTPAAKCGRLWGQVRHRSGSSHCAETRGTVATKRAACIRLVRCATHLLRGSFAWSYVGGDGGVLRRLLLRRRVDAPLSRIPPDRGSS